jgi:hypothetical protein
MDIAACDGTLSAMQRIIHSCGHEQEHYIIGEYAADCDRKAIRLARQRCDACRTSAAEAMAVKARTAMMGLEPATLQGSSKQIAWAETIRAKRLSVLQCCDRDAATFLAGIVDAKWWIDRRSEPDAVIIASAAAQVLPV